MRLQLWTIFILIFLLPLIVNAQYQESSLYRVYKQTVPFFSSDTAQINVWLKAAREMTATHPADASRASSESGLALLKKAKTLSLSIGYTTGAAISLLELSSYYNSIYNNKKARELLREAYPYCTANSSSPKNNYGIIWHIRMASTFVWGTEKDSAMIYLRNAEKSAIQANDTNMLLTIYFNIGSAWLSDGNPNNALYYLKKTEQIAQQSNSNLAGLIYNNIATIYNERNNLDSAYYYATRALAISLQKNWKLQQEIAYNCLGNYFLKSSKNDSAAAYYQKAIALQTGNVEYRRISLWGLGNIAYQKRDLKQAIQYALQGAEVDKNVILKADAAISFYRGLSILYSELGDYQSAYQYEMKLSKLRDSTYNTSRAKTIDKLETQWRVAEKDKELAEKRMLLLKEKGKIKNRNIWIAATSLCIISIAILFFSFYRSSKRKIHILQQQEEINKLKAVVHGEEKERTRIARELHDGIGGLVSAANINLNMLGDEHPLLVKDAIYQKTEMLIDSISREVRKTAHNLMPDILLRHNLPEAIRLFCAYVQKEGKLDIKILENGSFEKMQQDFLLSVYRIVQELIQNIIKHAKATNVFIQLHTNETMMSITVEDDGIGYDTTKAGNGMGLQNIQTRVKAMNGNINIESGYNRGTSVYIEFDIKRT